MNMQTAAPTQASRPGSTPKSRNTHGPTHAGRMVATLCVLLIAFCLPSWAASEKVLHAFHGTDGCGPNSVIVGADGALYGTTIAAGSNCYANGTGAVFQLTRGSDGKWSETVLHLFSGSDGWAPVGPLVADKAGNLYGTTVYGGPNGCSGLGCGVAFELERGNDGEWTFSILHLFFQQIGDGLQPYVGMIFDSKGNLYGTTSHGGNMSACDGGCGVVYELSPAGKGQWTETVLYSFDATDGLEPGGPLVFDSSGNLYGTTEWGGGVYGSGTVFKLSQRHGLWSEEILHSFDGDTRDGGEPGYGVTFDGAGNLYGATPFGGTEGMQGWGTAFKLTPSGGGKWKETVLHRFNRAKFDGGYVSSGLVLDKSGNLYGTTNWGGKYACPGSGGLGCGVVFKLTPQPDGKWIESVLHSFGHHNDGMFPLGGIVFDSSGNLFGVTDQGGHFGGICGYGCGTVFEIIP